MIMIYDAAEEIAIFIIFHSELKLEIFEIF